MKKGIIITVTLLAPFLTLQASDGIDGFDFLRWDAGARPSALGGAFIAVPGDIFGVAYNPASLFGASPQEAALSYHSFFMDMQTGSILYGRRVRGGGHVAVGLFYLNYGEMRRTNIFLDDLGSFSPGDVIFSCTYADSISHGLVYGISAKTIYSHYDEYSAAALALDAGILCPIPSQSMYVGLSVSNAGLAVKNFFDERETLPVSIRAGVSKRLAHLPLLINFALIRYLNQASEGPAGLYWALGGEFSISERVYLRWGYNSRGREETTQSGGRFAGFSAGLGLELSRWQVDCGWNFYGILGDVPSVTVRMLF